MTSQPGSSDFKPSARGEAAWKEAREAIASRNADTRKSGRAERETYERGREAVRRAADAQRHAKLLKRRTP